MSCSNEFEFNFLIEDIKRIFRVHNFWSVLFFKRSVIIDINLINLRRIVLLKKLKIIHLAYSICIFCSSFVEAVCVVSESAQLRSSPSYSASVSWVVGKYMPLDVIKSKGSWLQVRDVDGEKHWVLKNTVSDRLDCLVVKARQSNLRTGPGPSFEKAPFSMADRYFPFKHLGGEDGWYYIEDDYGNIAWIFSGNVWRPKKSQSKIKMNL